LALAPTLKSKRLIILYSLNPPPRKQLQRKLPPLNYGKCLRKKKTCKQVNTQTKEQSGLKTEGGIELATKTERVGVNTNELSRVDAEENLKGIDAREAAQAKKAKKRQ